MKFPSFWRVMAYILAFIEIVSIYRVGCYALYLAEAGAWWSAAWLGLLVSGNIYVFGKIIITSDNILTRNRVQWSRRFAYRLLCYAFACFYAIGSLPSCLFGKVLFGAIEAIRAIIVLIYVGACEMIMEVIRLERSYWLKQKAS